MTNREVIYLEGEREVRYLDGVREERDTKRLIERSTL